MSTLGGVSPLSLSSATSIIKLSSSASAIEPTRGIWCTVAGTADLTDANGHTETSVAIGIGVHPISVIVVNNIATATLYALR